MVEGGGMEMGKKNETKGERKRVGEEGGKKKEEVKKERWGVFHTSRSW